VFSFSALHPDNNWVVDIGWLQSALSTVTQKYHLKDLDEICPDQVTTTEWMAQQLFSDIVSEAKKGSFSFSGSIRVTVKESDVAEASYENSIE